MPPLCTRAAVLATVALVCASTSWTASSALLAATVNEYPNDPLAAAQALLERVVPSEFVPSFRLELIPPQRASAAAAAEAALLTNGGDVEVMQLSSDPANGTVVLRGSGGVEIASALNWYMNDYLNITYDWNTYGEGQWQGAGRFVGLGEDSSAASGAPALPLPPVDGAVRPRQLAQSYYMNVCTPGYSLAFVDWDYWQKHIDWMALNGINLPLALTGMEYVWNQVWTEFNLTAEDTAPFYSGPAFLPWYRMGNMRGWGGPLTTAAWMESQKDLQLQILARQRGLGMRPVLGGFAGFVPAALRNHYPNASMTRAPAWANFAAEYGEVYQLAPVDPLFPKIGGRFIELQAQIYGTDHIYSCDTFNEMDPPSGDLDALEASSKAVYGSMAAIDSDAVWLMQAWLFIHDFWTKHPERVKAYLSGVPTPTVASPGGMWILDLEATANPVWPNTEAFYGKPFILCTLLDFGGQQGLFGNMGAVESSVQQALNASAAKSASPVGVGITMEGIWTNYGVFEKALSLSWTPQTISNDTSTSFATPVRGYYIDGYPAGAKTVSFTTLQEAQAACAALPSTVCGGVTEQNGSYEIRAASYLSPDPAGATSATSWLRIDDDARRFATRRYGGASDGSVAAWENFLWPLYHGGPGQTGAGSVISSIPNLPTKPGPPPPVPDGYERYSSHGYWGNPALADVCSLSACARYCSGNVSCKAFEVYLEPTPMENHSNCYLFSDLTLPFTALGPCQTFVKKNATSSLTLSPRHWQQIPQEPHSMMEYVAQKLASTEAQRLHPTSAVYEQLLPKASPGSPSVLAAAWTALMEAIPDLGEVASFQFDLVDVARSVIAANFSAGWTQYQAAFAAGLRNETLPLGQKLLSVIDDYDTLLSSNGHFMLGRWIQFARNSIPGATSSQQDWLEFNARNQITLWGPHGEINDYAKKEWGGLVRDYYRARYELLFTLADQSLSSNTSWSSAYFNQLLLQQVEEPWSNATNAFPSTPEHDLLEILPALHQKYVSPPFSQQ